MDKGPALSALSALANETRLDIVRLLVSAGDDGKPAGVIAEYLGMSSSRLSFHLSALENAHLINAERVGRNLIYRAKFDSLDGLIHYLTIDCCGGQCGVNPER